MIAEGTPDNEFEHARRLHLRLSSPRWQRHARVAAAIMALRCAEDV